MNLIILAMQIFMSTYSVHHTLEQNVTGIGRSIREASCVEFMKVYEEEHWEVYPSCLAHCNSEMFWFSYKEIVKKYPICKHVIKDES